MEWTEKQILETLRFIEECDYDEVRLETADFKLHVRKRGAPASLEAVSSDTALASHAEAVAKKRDTRPDTSAVPKREAAAVPPGMVAIRAPMVGTFYRAPAPHLPPFVEVGAHVKADDTVCLIEVMKLFNTIKAGTSGTVVDILAQNAATVRHDEVLIVIEPRR